MTDFAELWPKNAPTISFELFPPRSEKAAEKLGGVVRELLDEAPDFVSVTFGAGGSSREGSHRLAEQLLSFPGQRVVAYLAGIGLGSPDLEQVALAYRELGVHSILCVRGDVPDEWKGGSAHPQGPRHASDLVELVRTKYDGPLGVAGYPEGHVEAASKEEDWSYLKAKVDKGASYVISQYFYDNGFFFDFVAACRRLGIGVPIVAGVMPIYSVKMTQSLATRCGATLTPRVTEFLHGIDPDDKEAIEDFGVELGLRQCRELIARGVDGLHFYTMDRSSSVRRIVRALRNEGLLGST